MLIYKNFFATIFLGLALSTIISRIEAEQEQAPSEITGPIQTETFTPPENSSSNKPIIASALPRGAVVAAPPMQPARQESLPRK